MASEGASRRRVVRRLVSAFLICLPLVGVAAWSSTADGRTAVPASLQHVVTVDSAQPTGPVKYYIVGNSYNGQQEFLYEIAERFLGNGNRYMEIFNLNKGRPQPGGDALKNPTSLLAGWVLVLPDDAKGPGVRSGPLPSIAPSATPSAPRQAGGPMPSASRPSASHGRSGLLWVALGAAAAVIAAGAGSALLLRRRRGKPAARSAARIAAPRTAVDRSAVWTIDRALKALAVACDDEHIPFPGVYLVTVDAASVSVTVPKPSAKAPAGWTASRDGRTWSAQLAALQASNVRDTVQQSFTGLVMLGVSNDGQVLLDLDQAVGPIAIDGPKAAVDAVIEAWIAELTTNPWSATVRVARIGARSEPDLDSAERLLADLEAGERALVIFEEPPSRSQVAALRDRLTSVGTAWVLVRGTTPMATWKFTADDGVLSSGFLPDIRYGSTAGAPRRGPLFRASN